MQEHRFGPAGPDEAIVFGACRPDHNSGGVDAWVAAMRNVGIQRVVCLLDDDQLTAYEDLLGQYRKEFGQDNVLSAPVDDYHLIDSSVLDEVLAFLRESDQQETRVVIHCYGGSGRTGHVLAAWLVAGRGYDVDSALEVVSRTRRPREAIEHGNATDDELRALLTGALV